MQDILVGICVAVALLFVARNLWNKVGSQKQGGCGCGCSGCSQGSSLRVSGCPSAEKPKPPVDEGAGRS